jgi:cAMP-specific phosphodiesterase 4
MHFYFQSQAFSKLFSPEEKMAVLVASAVHDVSHPGNNNNFEVEAETDIAITYNDQSVLENFHLATAFRILKQTGHNIFGHLPKKTQRMLRDLMIHAVLATDMKLHVRLVALLQSMVQKKKAQGTWFDASKVSEERKELLGIAIHTADISSASKRLPIALEWAHRIHDEFWNQGDQERSLDIPVVPVMDRNKPNFAKSQMAFISFIVDPLYDVFVQVVPESQVCLRQQKSNYGYWQARIDVGQAIKNRLREDQE